ncbi:response regulator [Mucilaginibacter celer]|uniref:Response regulator n=1 Tax=Mucilaginibacter celer TaxID=2305508 RepID=A0A494VJ76_9SPHI|nr:response regulator transcription factor [Mucilaginibacter celer]AYL93819.1 response regulator [Mucilaginibacter celer]
MIRVSIIEDDTFILKSIVNYLQMQPELHVESGFSTVNDFLKNTTSQPHVLLLDIELPAMCGLEGAFLIKQKFPDINILMLTVYEDKERVFKALQAGATGYLLKSTPLNKIKASIIEAAQGGVPMSASVAKKVLSFFSANRSTVYAETHESLTNREIQISNLLIKGDTYKQIAHGLFISPDTVRQHIKNIYRKLQINSRVQLINEFNKRKRA